MVLRLFLIASLLFLAGCGDLSFDNPTDPSNISNPDNIIYKSFSDARDGKYYNIVDIGEQTWMAENLNYDTTGSVCNGGYCNIYGRLYDWATAKDVCPYGWHLPTIMEWNTLLGVASWAQLKSMQGWSVEQGQGTDVHGFSALPGGSNEDEIGSIGFWWSNSVEGSGRAHFVSTSGNNVADVGNLYSVRCVKSKECGTVPYNVDVQFCGSDTKVHDLCGGKTFDPVNQRCGLNNVLETKCGTGWYNPEIQFCRGGASYDLCAGKEYDPTINSCGVNNVLLIKCGTGWYDKETQFCVGNSSYDLCAGKTYDPVEQRCGASSIVETKCGTWWYDAASGNSQCNNGVAEIKCGTVWYRADTYFCVGGVSYELCAGRTYDPVNQRCGLNNVIESKCGANWYDPGTQLCSNGTLIVFDTLTDVRDGNKYKIVDIGSQTWMAENLNYDKAGECPDAAHCAIYGRFYNWETANGVCPVGWHLPSNAEWNILYRFADGTSGTESPYISKTAGKILKAKNGWSGKGNGTDDYGFSALPGGGGSGSSRDFHRVGESGEWWSSTEYSSGESLLFYYQSMGNEDDGAYWGNGHVQFTSDLYSIRCVRD